MPDGIYGRFHGIHAPRGAASRGERARTGFARKFVDIGQNLFVPDDLGPDPHPGVLGDQIVGGALVRPAAVELVLDPGAECVEGRDPVLEVATQQFRVEIVADGQREIEIGRASCRERV